MASSIDIYGTKPYARVHLGHLSESRSAPGGRQLVGQAANLTLSLPIGRTFAHRHVLVYSTMRLILVYRPTEGGRLSRPWNCTKCSARAKSCDLQ